MTEDRFDDLRHELDDLRERLEHLRVQANLGKMEMRDRLEEIGNEIEPRYQKARQRIGRILEEGADRSRNVARSLEAGWDEVRRTYRDLSEKRG